MLKNKLIIPVAALLCILFFTACGKTGGIPDKPREINGLKFTERTTLQYANQFAIDRYDDGYSVIYTPDSAYMLVPENKATPESLTKDMKIINTPIDNVYLTATAAMGLFDALGEGQAVRFSGAKAEDWYIDYAKKAMQNGGMLYAGKYREPDYELLLSEGCKLSIQSTMIGHSPDVKEKLEELGITVFVDYSSYESHPLGRSEWIKVYAEMLGQYDKACELFDEQTQYLKHIGTDSTGKTAVFFYINNSGQAVTRKSGDYVTKMIEIAGGEHAFKTHGEGQTSSSVTMEMEKFYSTAKDADFIIYNSTIGGEISSVDELIAKNNLIKDFKAVKEGRVWCTRNNLFQETMKTGAIISDFNAIFTDNTAYNPPQYLYRLEGGERLD